MTARIDAGPKGRRRRRADRRGARRAQVRAPARGAVVRGGDGRAGAGRRDHARSQRRDRRGGPGRRRREGAPRRSRSRSPPTAPAPDGGTVAKRRTTADGDRGGSGSAPPASQSRLTVGGRAARWSPVPRRRRCRASRIEVQAALDRDVDLVARAGADAVARLERRPDREPGGIAAFTLDLLALDACPSASRCSALEARACAAGSLGRLAAQGSHTYDPRSVARPFATAGGTVRLAVLCRVARRGPRPVRRGGDPVARCVPSSIPRCFTGSLRLPWSGTWGSACGFRDRMTAASA